MWTCIASIPNGYSTIESFIEMDRFGVYCVSCFDVLFCCFFFSNFYNKVYRVFKKLITLITLNHLIQAWSLELLENKSVTRATGVELVWNRRVGPLEQSIMMILSHGSLSQFHHSVGAWDKQAQTKGDERPVCLHCSHRTSENSRPTLTLWGSLWAGNDN